jgi:uncharacterized membrane protein
MSTGTRIRMVRRWWISLTESRREDIRETFWFGPMFGVPFGLVMTLLVLLMGFEGRCTSDFDCRYNQAVTVHRLFGSVLVVTILSSVVWCCASYLHSRLNWIWLGALMAGLMLGLAWLTLSPALKLVALIP